MSVALEKTELEKNGPAFVQEQMLMVRGMTRGVIRDIAARCKPGMLEEEAIEIAKEILAEKKMLRSWHDVHVRFGANTIKTFGAPSEPGVRLAENDIMFVDIGPVYDKWEGDGGETFVFGSDADMRRCADDVVKLFHIVRKKWELEKTNGKELYEFAVLEARKMGWELNLDLSGHRLSDFPHAAVYDGPMADVTFCPSPLLWVLEMHIRHPTKPYGAFFEDMLLDDSYFA
ncbi:M24 family metallopeptidase [Acidocella sp.]|uniref:M24 family metallopeptidase n=1 Tax=Acidocella sp. TaxID=50710 RepID=UPI003D034EA2